MQQLLPLIVLIVAITVGVFIALLFFRLYNKQRELYIQHLFYHQILLLIFGMYGLIGGALLSNFLLKYAVQIEVIERVIAIVFYLSYPILVLSIFMLFKACMQLLGLQMRMAYTIVYFVLSLAIILLLAYTIDDIIQLYQNDFFTSAKYFIFAFFELFQIVIFFGFTFFALLKKQCSAYIRAAILFFLIYHSLILLVFVLSNYAYVARLYFVLFYFSGNAFLIYLIPKIQTNTTNIPAASPFDEIAKKFGITSRERQVIEEICKGKTNKEIAETLFISLQTVKDHTHNIFKKVDVKNRIQLRNMFSINSEHHTY